MLLLCVLYPTIVDVERFSRALDITADRVKTKTRSSSPPVVAKSVPCGKNILEELHVCHLTPRPADGAGGRF